ncbi:MAG: hypothetical protein MJ016_00715 [Victivallaceae bacterium]|nr:hypothetical protein [Victivallaceae bacterium]
MKKFGLVLTIVCAVASGVFAGDPGRETNFGEALALYLPNRVLDLLDTFSVTLGVGPVAEGRLMFTRACDVGAGIGLSCKAAKDFNRQYGFGIEEYWYWSLVSVGEESYSMNDGIGRIQKYQEDRLGVPDPQTRTYDFFEGRRDYWAIGGALGLLVDGNVYIHPVEWADLALGFLFIDIRNDDLIFDDFR